MNIFTLLHHPIFNFSASVYLFWFLLSGSFSAILFPINEPQDCMLEVSWFYMESESNYILVLCRLPSCDWRTRRCCASQNWLCRWQRNMRQRRTTWQRKWRSWWKSWSWLAAHSQVHQILMGIEVQPVNIWPLLASVIWSVNQTSTIVSTLTNIYSYLSVSHRIITCGRSY